MSGDASPWRVTFLVVLNGILVLMMMTVGLMPRALRMSEVRCTLRCPGTGRFVFVRFLTDEAFGPSGRRTG
jgi:hypothetical protein